MATLLPSDSLTYQSFGQLSYLERVADSRTVTVFFHGLGLDATDYQGYLESHETHGIAVNLAGYAPRSAGHLPPVPAKDHVEMVAGLVRRIGHDHPEKRIVLVGFSLGADLVLQLAEHWTANPDGWRPSLFGALLLDPNVNRSTMTISRLFAAADRRDPLPALKKLVDLAPDLDGFRALCTYASRIAAKDFGQVRQLADDMMHYWDPTGYDQFGERVARVAAISNEVNIVLSADYGEHLREMEDAVRRHGAPAARVVFNITEMDHFGLIEHGVLHRQLKSLGCD
ncbi:alpha/beta hydrolase [Streptomyces actinomycinicus]|uniref:Alpha/beta hydrolase n=1 Tax=Streptomyces actinomycinicus TaxID=1695166 RepID=A0A937JMV2_9ACTN|nr:alpha/beta hydrolase [Streptomyces actinomycinicus]MBL1083905.1 alpha/beta hydrolase [Streptomyces actinomycinicus]